MPQRKSIKKSLIIPAAGKSSRFPDTRPKWLLTHPAGNLMVTRSIECLDYYSADKIYVAVLKEHIDKYCTVSGIKDAFVKAGIDKALVEIVVIDNPTRSQPETVATVIEKYQISGAIFIKDVDSYFECEIPWNNSVATYDLNQMDLAHARNKSYVTSDDNGIITNIVEKQVISSQFCVGGYSFQSASDFMKCYDSFNKEEEFYISHMIFKMMLSGNAFKTNCVHDYVDWGTLKEWNNFKSSYATLFVDIDGVLVENSSEFFTPRWGETDPIQENIDKLNEAYNSGKVKIILTTARGSEFSSDTEDQLSRLNVNYHQIIYDLYHAKRIIINDYAKSNPYKSCDAINIRRNSSELSEMLSDCFKN